MTKNGKTFLVLYLLGIGTLAALAANDTIGVTAGSGKTGNLIKFGSNNVISEVGICDATTENQCATVSAGGAVKTDSSATTQPVSNAGTFAAQLTGATNNINNIAGTVSLPTGAATSANQTTELASLATIVTNTGAAIPAGTNTIGSVNGAPNVTPNNCGSTVVTGGTAVNAFTNSAGKRGFVIANIDTAEVLWISFTTTALAGDTQSFPLAPATATTFAGLSSFTSPMGFGLNTSLSVVAATNGHKFSCTWW